MLAGVAAVLPLVLAALPARGAEGDLDVDSFGFGTGVARIGVVSSDASGVGVAIQMDGKILVAGVDGSSNEGFVARFGSDGNLDAGFGSGGIAHTGVSSSDFSGVGVAVQVDGKILLAGVDGSSSEDFVARFDSGGTLDAGFGSSGIAYTGVFSSGDSSVAVAVQADGKILLAGVDGSNGEDFVARFIGTPVSVNPVPTLNGPGFVLLALLMLLAVALVAGKQKRGLGAPKRIV